jgi:hypothetical protein
LNVNVTIGDSIAAYIDVPAFVAFTWHVVGPVAVNSSTLSTHPEPGLTRVYVTAPLLVPPIVERITVELFLTDVTLFEIRNGLCVAKMKGTSTVEELVPEVATIWHVVALVAVRSVPMIRQFGVVVE